MRPRPATRRARGLGKRFWYSGGRRERLVSRLPDMGLTRRGSDRGGAAGNADPEFLQAAALALGSNTPSAMGGALLPRAGAILA